MEAIIIDRNDSNSIPLLIYNLEKALSLIANDGIKEVTTEYVGMKNPTLDYVTRTQLLLALGERFGIQFIFIN